MPIHLERCIGIGRCVIASKHPYCLRACALANTERHRWEVPRECSTQQHHSLDLQSNDGPQYEPTRSMYTHHARNPMVRIPKALPQRKTRAPPKPPQQQSCGGLASLDASTSCSSRLSHRSISCRISRVSHSSRTRLQRALSLFARLSDRG